MVAAAVFALPGVLFLYAASRQGRWDSSAERLVAIITGASDLALAAAVGQAAFTSGSTRWDLGLAGGLAAGAGVIGRRIVRARWQGLD